MMKDILKNTNFYYIAGPIVIGLWVLFLWAVSLPESEKNLEKYKKMWTASQVPIEKILNLDPGRLEYEKLKGEAKDFDYATVVDQFATLAQIPESKYSLTGRGQKKVRGRKAISADLSIKQIDIAKLAVFLSAIQLPWPDLQCDQLNLIKQKSGPDVWNASIKFTYFF